MSKEFTIWESQDCRNVRSVTVWANSGKIHVSVGDFDNSVESKTISLCPAYARNLVEALNACIDHIWRDRG